MDELFRSRVKYQPHEEKLYHAIDQPTEDIILGRNAELRKNPDAINDFGKGTQTWGRMIASIPMITLEQAIRDGYDIYCKDSEIAGKELNRFLQSIEGRACLVQG